VLSSLTTTIETWTTSRYVSSIPQDVLLIHEIIGVTNETLCTIFSKTGVGSLSEDSIDSSEKDNDASEEEIEADLVITEEDGS
jgi:hypothetical protein